MGIGRSFDGGTTWLHDTILAANYGWSIVFDPVDSMRVYIAGDSATSHPALYITTNLGQTWTSSRAGLAGKIWDLALAPRSGGQVLYAASGSGVFKSTDAGATWTGTGFTIQTRALVVAGPDTVYAGTYGSGVHVSTNGGANWVPMNEGLTNQRVLSLGLSPGAEPALFAGTEGGSVFRSDFYTGFAEQPGPVRSRPSFRVVPNPARGHFRLDYAAGVTTTARAALYDAGGRLVADLGEWRPGPGSADRVISTGGIPVGTYFVRLAADGRNHTARLTILE